MEFYNWLSLHESNLQGLYSNTVRAFPRTTKRQYAIDEIKIIDMSWLPYKGVRTLFVKGLAKNEENGKEYKPIILFKNVRYKDSNDRNNLAEIDATDGRKYFFEKLSDQNDVVLRCNCNDFHWRWNYTDKLDKSLYGSVRKKYEAKEKPGSSNPLELPGMCKHLIKLAKSLNDANILEG